MDELPDSLLLEIFRYLPLDELCLGARMVCRRWRAITHDSELWKFIDIPEHYTDDRTLLLMKQIHETVEDIECTKCENLTKKTFVSMGEIEFPKLKHLGLPIDNFKSRKSDILTDDVFHGLAKACPYLENLENIAAPPKEHVENGVHEEIEPQAQAAPPENVTLQPLQIQALFGNLTTVHDKPVYVYGRLRDGGANGHKRRKWLNDLQSLSTSCPEVTTYRCRRGQRYMDNEGLENIGKLFPNLSVLELYHTSIDDEGLRLFFAQHKGILSELIFDNPGSLTDAALKIIALNCPKLGYLKLSHVSGITNEGVEFLAQRCTNLSELHLNNSVFSFRNEDNENKCHFNNDCLAAIGKNCRNMANFRLLNSEEVSSPALEALAENCRFLTGIMLYECPLVDDRCLEILREMPFLKAAVLVNCHAITPAGIIHLVLHAPSLLRLTLFVNTDKCMTFYGDHSSIAERVYGLIDAEDHPFRPCTLRKLTVKGVGGMFLQLLTVLCPDLHTLDLRDAVVMNQTAFRYVLLNCENLRILDIQYVPNIKDAHLAVIAECGHSIKKVALGRNVKDMSTEALSEVLSKCRSLKYLSMDFNTPIKVPGVDPPAAPEPTATSSTAQTGDASGGAGGNDDDSCKENQNHLDLNTLLKVAQDSHGGLCFLQAVADETLSPQDLHTFFPVHRHLEFNFTPIKYLGSINTASSAASPQ